MMERFAEATWLPATSNAGPFTGGAAKGLLHTTEGHRFADALNVYKTRGFWAHATLTYETGRFQAWQHLDLDVAAKALAHPPGTAPTNTDHVVQVEIVGSADRAYAHAHGLLYVEDFPVAYLAGISRWMRYVERVAGVMRVSIAPFGRPGTVRRLTVPEWHGTSGWCGHMHVPNNDHSDPGAIAIRTLLAGGPSPPPPFVVTPFPEDHMQRIDITVPGLDNEGHGDTVLDGNRYPAVAAGKVVSVRVNTAGHGVVPADVGDQDYAGHAQIQWVGPANASAFLARVWVAD